MFEIICFVDNCVVKFKKKVSIKFTMFILILESDFLCFNIISIKKMERKKPFDSLPSTLGLIMNKQLRKCNLITKNPLFS